MTPEEARELLIQAKCEQNTHKGYRDALHVVSGLRYEYAAQAQEDYYEYQGWAYIDSYGTLVEEPGEAFWLSSEAQALREAQSAFEYWGKERPLRIVRRLVSPPEVIE